MAILYAGAIGLLIGIGGRWLAACIGGCSILATALLAFAIAPEGALELAAVVALALVAYNVCLTLGLAATYFFFSRRPA